MLKVECFNSTHSSLNSLPSTLNPQHSTPMVTRFLFLTALIIAVMLCAVEIEREYRELQTIRTRQVFQKQILLEQQSQLRLELQQITQPDGQ